MIVRSVSDQLAHIVIEGGSENDDCAGRFGPAADARKVLHRRCVACAILDGDFWKSSTPAAKRSTFGSRRRGNQTLRAPVGAAAICLEAIPVHRKHMQ